MASREADRAPTLRDVAERAGVSAVTVSSVLNGSRSNTRVSPQTRERITAAAAALRYQPSAVALSLRRRRTDILGFYCGQVFGMADAGLLFFSDLIRGLQEGCETGRKDLLMHGVFRRRPEEEVYRALAGGMIDGLVLYAPETDPLVARLAASHLPTVALAEPLPGIASFVADDAGGGRLQAGFLAARGHRRVLYRAATLEAPSTTRRLAGFRDAAAEAGLRVDTLGHPEGLPPDVLRRLRLPVGSPERPTAVVCWNDDSAREMLAEMERAELAAGPRWESGEIGVVGFDGVALPYPPARRLTTIHAPWRDAAEAAVARLVLLLEGAAPEPSETVLPVSLIAGDTA